MTGTGGLIADPSYYQPGSAAAAVPAGGYSGGMAAASPLQGAQPTGQTYGDWSYTAGVYHDWDINESTYWSGYLVMGIGIFCAVSMWRAYGSKKAADMFSVDAFSLGVQYSVYAVLEGIAFGLIGASHHILAYYDHEGLIMSREFFRPHSEWLTAWALGLFVAPLASGSLLGAAMSYSNTGPGWARWVKVFSVLVGLAEGFLCFVNLDTSGKITMYWGCGTSIVGLVLSCKEGWAVSVSMFVGFAFRTLAYVLLGMTPKGCWSSQDSDFCPYPAEFNQRAVFNVLNVAAIVFVFGGAMAKLNKMHASYRPTPDGMTRRCCSGGL